MEKLNHEIAPPPGWAAAWIDRRYRPLDFYISGVGLLLSMCMLWVAARSFRNIRCASKELSENPSNRAVVVSKMYKRAHKTDKLSFKLALAYMANAIVIVLVDSGISMFVLYKDATDNPDVWDRDMVMSVGIYAAYLLVLFLASFILVPLLQMLAVTWVLTRFSRKNNMSDYVPQARAISSVIAFIWASACFAIVAHWPVVGGSDDTATRFVVLEAAWGSALAWLEAGFIFNYLGHTIGDTELNRGNGVGEIVSMFAKAATSSFSKKPTVDALPRYEEVAREEPLSEKR